LKAPPVLAVSYQTSCQTPSTSIPIYRLLYLNSNIVIPAKAGIQGGRDPSRTLDSRLRGNDE